jgi:hypothetical protein
MNLRLGVVVSLLAVAGCLGTLAGDSADRPTTLDGCSYNRSVTGIGADQSPTAPPLPSTLNNSTVERFATTAERVIAYHTYHQSGWNTSVSLSKSAVTTTDSSFVVTIQTVDVASRGPDGVLDAAWSVRYSVTNRGVRRTVGMARSTPEGADGPLVVNCSE